MAQLELERWWFVTHLVCGRGGSADALTSSSFQVLIWWRNSGQTWLAYLVILS